MNSQPFQEVAYRSKEEKTNSAGAAPSREDAPAGVGPAPRCSPFTCLICKVAINEIHLWALIASNPVIKPQYIFLEEH